MPYYNRNHYRRFRVTPRPLAEVKHKTLDTADGVLEWTEVTSWEGDRMRRVRGEGALAGQPIDIHDLEQRILHHAIWFGDD